MVKKTRPEIEIDIEELKVRIEKNTPSFISPNGGSLEEIQAEFIEIYKIILLIIENLKDSVWENN